MGSVTIRNIADEVKNAARLAAAKNGRSMEAELRALLVRTYADASKVGQRRESSIQKLIRLGRGIEFDAPPRQSFIVDEPSL